MSMFLRSDKSFDTGGSGSTARESSPPATDTKRPPSTTTSSDIAGSQPRAVSVISKSLKITGQLESTEDIQVDGEVDGDVRGASVKIGSNARVKGTVYGETVELSGTIDGKIEAKKVVLTSTAHMSGDVIHQDIRIESGAFIDGYCRPEFGKVTNKTVHPAPKPVGATPATPVREKTGTTGDFGSRP